MHVRRRERRGHAAAQSTLSKEEVNVLVTGVSTITCSSVHYVHNRDVSGGHFGA